MTAAQGAAILDAAAARQFTSGLAQLLAELRDVLAAETEAVRGGRLRDALAFEKRKADISSQYLGAAVRLKTHARDLRRLAPEGVTAVADAAARLQPFMQLNLTVLATAHAVAEGLVRGAATEATKQATPTTYSRYGRASAPARDGMQPLAVARTL